MNWHLAWRAGVVAMAVALAACGDEEDPIDKPDGGGTTDPVYRPGMGLNEEEPEGLPFILPEGLTVETPIKGYNSADPEDCDYKYEDQAKGHGEQVQLCLVFNNTTDFPINLQMPPGLIFVSRSREVQNGIIAQRISIEVPAKTRYYQPIFAYCTNSGRDTSALSSEFDLGKVTQYEDFQELFRILEGKTLSKQDAAYVDQAIGDLSDGQSLSAEQRARFNALP
ncbi:MAG: hypothetical protein EOO70_00835 [Myxococcaceae bacterium]|nr:MAG: hypothetical protein EOO70_00835 [Myxococcaceae bacterium]